MRRKANNLLKVNLSSILRMELSALDFNGKDMLEIVDDVKGEINTFSILNYYCDKYKIKDLYLIGLTINRHKRFLESFDQNNVNVKVLIKDASISKIYEEFDPTKEVITNEINEENITKIYNKDRYKIASNEPLSPNKVIYYQNEFLSNDDFLKAIDTLAFEISKYAKTDIEKVVLVNKIIKENLVFDWECSNEARLQDLDDNYIPKDSFNRTHIGHMVQSVFTRKKVVCSAISAFAAILLNHPLLNVKSKIIEAKSVIEKHAWNNVQIDNIWYSCDFTWSVSRDIQNNLKFVLIKARSKNNINDDSHMYSNNDYNKNELRKVKEKFKNIHITIPQLPMINKHLIERPTTVNTRRKANSVTGTRRKAVSVTIKPEETRRKGIKL